MNTLLYKYYEFNTNCKAGLSEGNIWFSNANKFNDPFEFKLRLHKNLEEKEVLDLFEFYKKLSVNPPKEIITDFNKVLYRYREDPEKFEELFLEPLIKHIGNFGVCCFSGVYDSILMWSHYANQHKGIVVGYDSETLNRSILDLNQSVAMTVIDQVSYTSTFPLIKIKASREKTTEEIRKVVFTKSNEWSYEKELRILSNRIGKHSINKRSIKRIFLGVNISENDLTELKSLISGNYLENQIEIIKMNIDQRDYALNKKYT